MNNFSFLKKVFTAVLSYESNIHLFNTNSRDYVLYATYCLINSFAPILFTNNAYDSISIIISYISGSACVFLLLNETWPENIKKYLIIYWYITVLFTLPVHSIFTVLSSSVSTFSITNFLLSVFILSLLVDWIKFLFVFPIGVLLGFILYIISYKVTIADLLLMEQLPEVLYMLVMVIFIAYVFVKKQQKTYIKKLANQKLLAFSIAHELRTPLSTLLGNIVLLDKRQNGSKANNQEIIHDIKSGISECHENINSILYTIKAPNNIALTLKNIADLLTNIIASYPFSFRERKCVKVDVKSFKYCVMVNELLFTQVINNILANALSSIKTKPKGDIFISLKIQGKTAKIYFKDTGIGMPKNTLENLFTPFTTNKKGGNGIGLAYSKFIITKMKGNIDCFSVDKKYTQFIIELPIF